MPTANNMAQLKRMIRQQMKSAMVDAQKAMYKKTQDETQGFYSQGNPELYERTGALGRTPQTTPISETENGASFEIYLDQSHVYGTGQDLKAMSALLPAAESGSYGILGRSGFWNRAESTFQRTLDSSMKKYFE